jgi:hypothetical protein
MLTPSTLPFSHTASRRGEGFKNYLAASPSPRDTLFVVWESVQKPHRKSPSPRDMLFVVWEKDLG